MRINPNAINVLSLAAIQGANALFPLLVFPYLLSVLGENSFAELVVVETLAFYVLTVCLYSFDTDGVQAIIEARSQIGNEEEAKVFFNILGARIFLFLCSSLPLSCIYYFFTDGNLAVFFIWMLFVLGMILQCNYYYQATENNWILAIFVFLSRVGTVIIIYFLIKSESDIILASVLLAGSFLVSGCAAFFVLFVQFGTSGLRMTSIKEVISLLCEGRYIFLGNISVALFRGVNVLILAWVSTSAAVSIYSLAEKVIKSIQALARPLNQVFIPKVIKAWIVLADEHQNKTRAFSLIWKNTRVQVFFMLFFLPLILSALSIANFLEYLPGFNNRTVFLILLMSPAVIFGVANAMFGVVGLNLIGEQSYFAYSITFVGGGIFLFSIAMSCFFSEIGAGICFLLAELLLLLSFFAKYRK